MVYEWEIRKISQFKNVRISFIPCRLIMYKNSFVYGLFVCIYGFIAVILHQVPRMCVYEGGQALYLHLR